MLQYWLETATLKSVSSFCNVCLSSLTNCSTSMTAAIPSLVMTGVFIQLMLSSLLSATFNPPNACYTFPEDALHSHIKLHRIILFTPYTQTFPPCLLVHAPNLPTKTFRTTFVYTLSKLPPLISKEYLRPVNSKVLMALSYVHPLYPHYCCSNSVPHY